MLHQLDAAMAIETHVPGKLSRLFWKLAEGWGARVVGQQQLKTTPTEITGPWECDDLESDFCIDILSKKESEF